MDGIVISRNVDVGQTVAASLQAPTLFTIANDLAKMEVHTNVDEADVGNVTEGQEVSFTVDAFPARRFKDRFKFEASVGAVPCAEKRIPEREMRSRIVFERATLAFLRSIRRTVDLEDPG